jgi:hypothetical protein
VPSERKVPAVLEHNDHTELGSHRHGAREELLDFLGPCAGGDVYVVGRLAEKSVAHTTTRKKRLMAGRAKSLNHPRGGGLHGGHVGRATRLTFGKLDRRRDACATVT